MDSKTELEQIVTKSKEAAVVPFLTSLDKHQKKELTPVAKELCKEYLEHRFVGSQFRQKGSAKQTDICHKLAFFFLDRRTFERYFSIWSVKAEWFEEQLTWYVPKWFNEYVNAWGSANFIPINISYGWVMGLADKGWSTPSPELIAKLLPSYAFERDGANKWSIRPNNLSLRPITLQEHIWYVFQYENLIYNFDQQLDYHNPAGDTHKWIWIFQKLAAEGTIDRQHLLEEALLATNRNFNKLMSNWCGDLFVALAPTSEELLALQPTLFLALNGQQSKPILAVLQALKTLLEHNAFDVASFFEQVPLLLSSDTKGILNATLSILDKLAKGQKVLAEQVCVAACQAFVRLDDEIQTRAAKLIAKHGTPENEAIREALIPYQSNLLANANTLLVPFMGKSAEKAEALAPSIPTTAYELVPLSAIDSIDELTFLCSQAFDNHEPHTIDRMAAGIVQLHTQIVNGHLSKLDPTLQKAYKLVEGGWTGSHGFLDHLAACFFINYCQLLISQYPGKSSSLAHLHDQHLQKVKDKKAQSYISLKQWRTHSNDTMYEPYKAIFLTALDKLAYHQTLPLLSTPTHAPAFISPEVLLERIRCYQANQAKVDEMDLQVAISRCDLSQSTSFVPLVKERLQGEWQQLFLFLLDPDAKPVGPFRMEAPWVVASITKNRSIAPELESFVPKPMVHKLTGQFPWTTEVETYTYKQYNYQKRQQETRTATRKTLFVLQYSKKANEPEKEPEPGFKSWLRNLLTVKSAAEKATPAYVYTYLGFKATYLFTEVNDLMRLCYLTPNNPEPLMALVARRALKSSTFSETTHQKLVAAVCESVLPLPIRFGEMGHLFIATCLLCSDKTVQIYAAEMWIKSVDTLTLDSARLGAILGKHQAIEFAPMKRFTDLIMSHCHNISEQHNRQLQLLLEAMLTELSKEPINGLKKLLEIYYEVLAKNGQVLPSHLSVKLQDWSSSSSLKKISDTLTRMG